MKKTVIVVVTLIVVFASYAAWSATRPRMTLEVVQPRIGEMRAFVEEQAVTQLPTDYLIAMPIGGWLEPIELREGDRVKAGQVVAQLDTADLEDRVRQAEQRIARLETKIRETEDHRLEENALTEVVATVKAVEQTVDAAEAKLAAFKAVFDFAASEVNRLRALAESDAANERELREALTELKKADAEYRSDLLELAALKTIEAVTYIGPKFIRDYIDRKTFTRDGYLRELDEAKYELQIVQRNLERASIPSPVDGVVLERHQTRRQFLAAGTPLLTIGRLADLEVIVEVLTEQATRISANDPVEIFGRALAAPITGRVKRVYPAGFKKISSLGVEQQRVNVAVGLDERPAALGVGFRVYVRILYARAEQATVLPRTALFRSPAGRWQVLVVRERRTVLTGVEVGLMNEDEAQIVSGVAPDEDVVARPSRDITAGMRVATRPAGA